MSNEYDNLNAENGIPNAENSKPVTENEQEPAKNTSANQKPFAAYAVVSQISFIVLLPLLLFIWGGSWLVDKLSLPAQMMGVFVVFGVVVMVGSLVSYLYKLIRYYDTDKKDKYRKLKFDNKDFDFYDDYKKK